MTDRSSEQTIHDLIVHTLDDSHGWDTYLGQCRCGWRVTADAGHPEHQAGAVLTDLRDAGYEVRNRPPDRWGFYLTAYPDNVYERYGEDSARRGINVNPEGRTLVRWPHGGAGWEVIS